MTAPRVLANDEAEQVLWSSRGSKISSDGFQSWDGAARCGCMRGLIKTTGRQGYDFFD